MLAGFLQGSSCPCLPVFSCTWLELSCLGRMALKHVHPTFLFLSLKTSWDDNLEQEERHLPTHAGVHQASAPKTLSIFHYQSELPSGSFQPLLHSAPHLDSALLRLLGYCLSDTSARVQESVYTQGQATFLLLPEWRVGWGTLFKFLLIFFVCFTFIIRKLPAFFMSDPDEGFSNATSLCFWVTWRFITAATDWAGPDWGLEPRISSNDA